MTLDYQINAQLRLQGGGGSFGRSMSRLSDRVRAFADRLRGARSLAGGLVRSLLSLGAGYVGFHALSSGLRTVIGGMFEFQQQVESARIGLQSIIAAVDGISFEEAAASADAVWSALSEDALASTATTQEMFDIFQGIVGPIRAAGASLETVRNLTGQTVAAASALGVDFEQAQRDMQLMVRGAAGMDTRMFSLLRSMNLIEQSTEDWNQNLTTGERIDALQEALSSFDDAASAYGHSFAGATSSFRDIVQQLGSSLAGPVFARLTTFLMSINDLMLTNRDRITSILESVGESAGAALSVVADRVFEAASFVLGHWDEISARMTAFAQTLREQAPHLARMAAALGALSALKSTLAPILTVVSSVIGALEAVGLIGGGAAAAEGGAAAGAAGAGAGASGAAAALGPLALALAAFAGVVVVVMGWWDDFVAIFETMLPILGPIGEELMRTGAALWEVLRPVLKILGITVISIVVPALMAFLVILRNILRVVRFVMEALATFANLFETYVVDPVIDGVMAMIRGMSQFFAALAGLGVDTPGTGGTPAQQVGRLHPSYPFGPGMGGGLNYEMTPEEALMNATPDARPQTVNNFHRGSVSVRQEFRQADPDRVLTRMIGDIDSQSERRVQSGFAPALTR